jgi:hypothetical protein
MVTPADRSDDEFLRTHERSIARLQKRHPEKPEPVLVHALRQAIGLTEPSGHAALLEVAALLLPD